MERVSSGAILLAFIAILCGLLGVYSLRQVLQRKETAPPPPPQLVTVPMASRDLEGGHTITLGDVALVKMTRPQMKTRGVTGMFMADPNQIIGRTLIEPITRKSTFDTGDFYPDGAGPGIAQRLGPGQRAVTVSIVGGNALIGFAGAGEIVDVLFKAGDWLGGDSHRNLNGGALAIAARNQRRHHQRQYGGQEYHARAITLMQGVKVLALENNTLATGSHKPVEKEVAVAVTLAVTPDQAEVLRLVEGNGEISLALRNPEDTSTFETIDSRTLEDVLGIRNVGPRELEVYRGTRVDFMVFDQNGQLSPDDEKAPQSLRWRKPPQQPPAVPVTSRVAPADRKPVMSSNR